MMNITINDLETKLYTELDEDITLFEESFSCYKKVIQYNPISKLYIVVKYNTITRENLILCITRKQQLCIEQYNMIQLMENTDG